MEESQLKLPSRFEGLIKTFGETTNSILLPLKNDISEFKKIALGIKRVSQGKLIFLHGPSGLGKSSFLYSLPVFEPQLFIKEIKLPLIWDLDLSDIPKYIAQNIERTEKITIVTIDRRESLDFDEKVFKGMMVNLNALLRERDDILIVWPVTNKDFAEQAINSIKEAGGSSPFALKPIMDLEGLKENRYMDVLSDLMTLSGKNLEDFAVEEPELEYFKSERTIGDFLDKVNELINERLDTSDLGVSLPTLLFVISSSDEVQIQAICRNLRRADKYLLEPARLRMDTSSSKAIEWWNERSTNTLTALPYIITMFKAQIVCLSPSSVVYSSMLSEDTELNSLVTGIQKNKGNGKKAINSSEFVRYFEGKTDFPKGGRTGTENTSKIYDKIQKVSEVKHKAINESIIKLALEATPDLFDDNYRMEQGINNIQSDALVYKNDQLYALEFHHKSTKGCTENKIAIYILEKLAEYAIAYGLASR